MRLTVFDVHQQCGAWIACECEVVGEQKCQRVACEGVTSEDCCDVTQSTCYL